MNPKPLPCPECGSKNIEVCANVVYCLEEECTGEGPWQQGPSYLFDMWLAVEQWNEMPRKGQIDE